MEHSKTLTEKEEEAVGVAMWDIATAMQFHNRVPTEYVTALSNAFKSAFNLLHKQTVDVTIQQLNEREWVVTAKSGEHWSQGVMKIPEIKFIG